MGLDQVPLFPAYLLYLKLSIFVPDMQVPTFNLRWTKSGYIFLHIFKTLDVPVSPIELGSPYLTSIVSRSPGEDVTEAH